MSTKTFLRTVFIAWLLSCSLLAHAHIIHNRYFAKVHAGESFFHSLTFQNSSTSPTKVHLGRKGVTLGVSAGYIAYPDTRVSIELSSRMCTVDSSETSVEKLVTRAAFANVSYDVLKTGTATPYILAGAGYAQLTPKNNSATSFITKHAGVALLCGVGSRFAISNTSSIDISYKYIYFGRPEIKSQGAKKRILAHEGSIGFVTRF